MKGEIVSWKDDRGFGFIASTDHSEKIFFHISSVKKAVRKPEVGDQVVLEVARDAQGRLKATHVLIEGVSLAENKHSIRIVTEPVSRDLLDYFLYVVLVLLLAATVMAFMRTGQAESALIPGAMFLAALYSLQNRKKQPSNKQFSCAKCRSVSNHDPRTIEAWNRGINRLYCTTCHRDWLREQPKGYAGNTSLHSSTKSGCLGAFMMIVFVPTFCAIAAIKWFA